MKKVLAFLIFGICFLQPAWAQKPVPPEALCQSVVKMFEISAKRINKVGNTCLYDDLQFGTGYRRYSIDHASLQMTAEAMENLPYQLPLDGVIDVVNLRLDPDIEGNRSAALEIIKLSNNSQNWRLSWSQNARNKNINVQLNGGLPRDKFNLYTELVLKDPSRTSFDAMMWGDQASQVFAVQNVSVSFDNYGGLITFLYPFLYEAIKTDDTSIWTVLKTSITPFVNHLSEDNADARTKEAALRFLDDLPKSNGRIVIDVDSAMPFDFEQAKSAFKTKQIPKNIRFYMSYEHW